MSVAPVVVLPDRTQDRGAALWRDGRWLDDRERPARLFAPIDGSRAFAARWRTDAHALPVVLFSPDGAPKPTPRLRKTVLDAWPADRPERPRLTWALVDVDGAGHVRAAADLERQLDALGRACRGLPFPVVYATRGGWRIAWPLDPPLDLAGAAALADAEGRMRALRRRIAGAPGGGGDRWGPAGLRLPDGARTGATAAATTCFRLPFVRRDGRDAAPDFCDLARVEPLDLARFAPVRPAAFRPPASAGQTPGWGVERRRRKERPEDELARRAGYVASAVEGDGHNALFRHAAALGELVAAGALDRAAVEAALEDAAGSRETGHPDASRTIRDGLARGGRDAGR